ncbi:DUF7692 domain-containing protein [Natrinema soli]|uniref:DUF7692 domain-containing protein n=1 Tax=Natrinema soli TaxID=1930624 RepID=UPI003CCD82BF
MQKAAQFYDCNRSNVVAFTCEDVDTLISAAVGLGTAKGGTTPWTSCATPSGPTRGRARDW